MFLTSQQRKDHGSQILGSLGKPSCLDVNSPCSIYTLYLCFSYPFNTDVPIQEQVAQVCQHLGLPARVSGNYTFVT